MEHGVTTLDVFLTIQFNFYFTSAPQSAKERECCIIGFIAWERMTPIGVILMTFVTQITSHWELYVPSPQLR